MDRLMFAFLIFLLHVLSPTLVFAAEATEQKPVLKTGFVEFPPFKYADEASYRIFSSLSPTAYFRLNVTSPYQAFALSPVLSESDMIATPTIAGGSLPKALR